MGLVLSNSKFFINKNSQGRKSVHEKSTYSRKFGFIMKKENLFSKKWKRAEIENLHQAIW